MKNRDAEPLTADILLRAYMMGIFPMAENVDDKDLFWVDPEQRGVLPLNDFHVSRSLKKTIRQMPFDIRLDTNFRGVMEACRNTRETSWINDEIVTLYCELARRGFAHSIECWQNNQLVGGLYGVAIGAGFFGESMFSLQTDASKIALCYLVARLKAGGYTLLDTQFQTAHLNRFGVIEMARAQYHEALQIALETSLETEGAEADFYSLAVNISPEAVLQLIGHKS